MNPFKRFPATPLAVLLLLAMPTGTAQAGIQAVGPVDPVLTIPSWYQDSFNRALVPCLDQNGFCILPPPFDTLSAPMSPITTTGPITDANLPSEGFYYSADASLPITGDLARLTFVMEYAFLAGVIRDTGIVFLRTDLVKMSNLTPNATYRVTHPYGTFNFTTDNLGNTTGGGGVAVRLEDPAGVAAQWLPPLMQSAQITGIGPFLTRLDGVFPTAVVGAETHTYIGDAATPVLVTGSPTGNNFFRIERLTAGPAPSSWQTNLFVLAGRLFTGTIASPMTIDSATYAKDPIAQQTDMFVTAQPAAVLTVTGTGIAPTVMTKAVPNTGKFFTHFTTIPTGVTITNSLDTPTPIPHPITLVDEVVNAKATFNPITRLMTINGASRDKVTLRTLTAPQFAPPNSLDITGTLRTTIPANTIPPRTVQVVSSGGGNATAVVSVVVTPPAPVAVADTATTPKDVVAVVNVLTNDTTAGTLDPATIVTATPVGGTAVANLNGTVTFTPTAGFSGAASFTYRVSDTFGQVSNSATVSVTVIGTPPATGVTLTPNLLSPQTAGTAVVFTALGQGSSGYQYQFWFFNGTSWSMVQDYGVGSTWTLSAVTAAGEYAVGVRVKTSTLAAWDAVANAAYTISGLTLPATGVTVTPDLPSPHPAGTAVVFTALGQGSSGYQYQFWFFNGTSWSMVQDFGVGTTWTLPALTIAGNYTVGVRVKTSALAAWDAVVNLAYTVQ